MENGNERGLSLPTSKIYSGVATSRGNNNHEPLLE